MIFHNSQDNLYRSPFGAVKTSSELKLSLFADYANEVILRLWTDEDGEKIFLMNATAGDLWEAVITAPDFGTILWYYFIVKYPSGEQCLYGAPDNFNGGVGREYQYNPRSFQITVYDDFKVPDWHKNGIMYQIFPDRFEKDSETAVRAEKNGRILEENWLKEPEYEKDEKGNVVRWSFYGGSLKGIQSKLSYLKELGISTIYLNPIFKAKSNHRYDTFDYMQIDPLLGSENDFTMLCSSARKADIHIILDGVFSHTGSDSIYFTDTKYKDWYSFNDDGSYKCWWGVKDLPEVNESDPGFTELICGKNGVIAKWLNKGAEGFRLDVADELPDSFIKNVRVRLKAEKKDSLLIGEVWEDASNKISHNEKRKFLMGKELDSVMNYPLRSMLLDFALFKTDSFEFNIRLMSLIENYPSEALYGAMNLLSSHDRVRLLTATDGNEERFMMLYALLFALPGVPCIYYGDEAGLSGAADPKNRACYPWGRENKRLLSFFKALCKTYNSCSCLKSGDIKLLPLNSDIIAFTRSNNTEKFLIAANRSNKTININFEGKEYDIPALTTIYKAV